MALDGVQHARGTVNRLAANIIGPNLLVAATATGNSVDLCGTNGGPVGISYDTTAAAAKGDIQLLTGGDRVLLTASAGINPGEFVKCAANGQVAPEGTVTTKTALTIATAESTASGASVLF